MRFYRGGEGLFPGGIEVSAAGGLAGWLLCLAPPAGRAANSQDGILAVAVAVI